MIVRLTGGWAIFEHCVDGTEYRSSRVIDGGRTRKECVREDFLSLRYTKSWTLKTFMSFPAIPSNVDDWRC